MISAFDIPMVLYGFLPKHLVDLSASRACKKIAFGVSLGMHDNLQGTFSKVNEIVQAWK